MGRASTVSIPRTTSENESDRFTSRVVWVDRVCAFEVGNIKRSATGAVRRPLQEELHDHGCHGCHSANVGEEDVGVLQDSVDRDISALAHYAGSHSVEQVDVHACQVLWIWNRRQLVQRVDGPLRGKVPIRHRCGNLGGEGRVCSITLWKARRAASGRPALRSRTARAGWDV